MTAKNFLLSMVNRTSLVQMQVENCERMDLQDNASQVSSGVITPDIMSLGNFQTAGVSGVGNLAIVDVTRTGISTSTAPGGWDNDGNPGPNQPVGIWAVGNKLTGQYGVCLSKHCSNGGPNLPGFDHSLRIGHNFMNAAANGFAFSIERNGIYTKLVGTQLPVVWQGLAAMWTPITNVFQVASPNAGRIGLTLRSYDPSSILAIASNQYWSSVPEAYIDNGAVPNDMAIYASVLPDDGYPGVWSTAPHGQVMVADYDDNW